MNLANATPYYYMKDKPTKQYFFCLKRKTLIFQQKIKVIIVFGIIYFEKKKTKSKADFDVLLNFWKQSEFR